MTRQQLSNLSDLTSVCLQFRESRGSKGYMKTFAGGRLSTSAGAASDWVACPGAFRPFVFLTSLFFYSLSSVSPESSESLAGDILTQVHENLVEICTRSTRSLHHCNSHTFCYVCLAGEQKVLGKGKGTQAGNVEEVGECRSARASVCVLSFSFSPSLPPWSLFIYILSLPDTGTLTGSDLCH